MIREVVYYQAVCDVCGAVDDQGEHSAWVEPEHARMAAAHAGWTELTAHDDLEVLVCDDHPAEGIDWCSTCEEDLDPQRWHATGPDPISQSCRDGHDNTIHLIPGHFEAVPADKLRWWAPVIQGQLALHGQSSAGTHADVLALIGALQRVRALGDAWEARGLSDMAFSEQMPLDCELALYEAGVDMVERARILRNTLDGAEEASGDE